MSFFNTFSRGFGRSSRKNKQQQQQQQAAAAAQAAHESGAVDYTHNNGSKTSLGSTNTNASSHQQKPLFLCQPFVRTALVKGSFQTIVMLPKYVDLGEWLALNIFEFFTYLNQFYGVISEFVTPQSCPTMNAGPGVDYLWIDSNKKAVRLPANMYIDYTLTWISSKFDDQTLFPTQQGVPFPAHFMSVLRNMYRQMFRIFAHIYHNHFDKIVHLSLEAHWNSFFAHFISFGKSFDLADPNDLAPLASLIEAMEAQGKIISS
ncbi:CBK1 kinase activator protein Mob2p [Trichomonascus vanleenenianus]|uniref:Mob2p n=1 Tax=Trichomonascus vanleenenianus TaxID=2268995 RepID=UPI003ECB8D7E